MELDTVLKAFFNFQTVIVCLAVYLMTFVIRKVLEGFWPSLKMNRLYREVWLPIGPICNGAFIGMFAKTFVWPAVIGTSLSGRIMYGSICGVFSALLYNRVRSFIQSKTDTKGGKKDDADDNLPMASDLPPMTTEIPIAKVPPPPLPPRNLPPPLEPLEEDEKTPIIFPPRTGE